MPPGDSSLRRLSCRCGCRCGTRASDPERINDKLSSISFFRVWDFASWPQLDSAVWKQGAPIFHIAHSLAEVSCILGFLTSKGMSHLTIWLVQTMAVERIGNFQDFHSAPMAPILLHHDSGQSCRLRNPFPFRARFRVNKFRVNKEGGGSFVSVHSEG